MDPPIVLGGGIFADPRLWYCFELSIRSFFPPCCFVMPGPTPAQSVKSLPRTAGPAPAKRRRADYPESENLCEHCTAKCCHYFALAIDEPGNRRDFDFMRWYLLHDRASVFVDDETWYLLVHTTCKHLREDHLCGIYETRPQICRDYTTAECEFEDDWCYEKYFESAEQIDEYADALYGPQFPEADRKSKHALRTRKPTGLPLA